MSFAIADRTAQRQARSEEALVDFELGEAELAFEREVEAFSARTSLQM